MAGEDMVGLDALGCGLLGVKPGEVMHIQLVHESGLGEMDLEGRVTRKMAAISHRRIATQSPGAPCDGFSPFVNSRTSMPLPFPR